MLAIYGITLLSGSLPSFWRREEAVFDKWNTDESRVTLLLTELFSVDWRPLHLYSMRSPSEVLGNWIAIQAQCVYTVFIPLLVWIQKSLHFEIILICVDVLRLVAVHLKSNSHKSIEMSFCSHHPWLQTSSWMRESTQWKSGKVGRIFVLRVLSDLLNFMLVCCTRPVWVCALRSVAVAFHLLIIWITSQDL